ncbi:VOC family protein [Burkholderiaceae bacterium DAT-1]|nr:VOC family protein [Burkholderiaceae bacterium DAT-1]
MIRGVNHITFAVSNLNRAIAFYCDVLGAKLTAKWRQGAYLVLGGVWICLSVDAAAKQSLAHDYTHIAFDIAAEDFAVLEARIIGGYPGAIWKDNRSEGASLYIHDPDFNKLELHVGNMASRLLATRQVPYEGMEWFD